MIYGMSSVTRMVFSALCCRLLGGLGNRVLTAISRFHEAVAIFGSTLSPLRDTPVLNTSTVS